MTEIDELLTEVFKDRRYCSDCEAMTPALGSGVLEFCECCKSAYEPMFPVRQRVIAEMSESMLNARRFLGNETIK